MIKLFYALVVADCYGTTPCSPSVPLPSLFSPLPPTVPRPTLTYPDYYRYTDEVDPFASEQLLSPSWSEDENAEVHHHYLYHSHQPTPHEMFGYHDEHFHSDYTPYESSDYVSFRDVQSGDWPSIPQVDQPPALSCLNNTIDDDTTYPQSSECGDSLYPPLTPGPPPSSSLNQVSCNYATHHPLSLGAEDDDSHFEERPTLSSVSTSVMIHHQREDSCYTSTEPCRETHCEVHCRDLSFDIGTPPTTSSSGSDSWEEREGEGDIVENIQLDWTEEEVNQLRIIIV